MARLHDQIEPCKAVHPSPASRTDFHTGPAAEVPHETVLGPDWSLYALESGAGSNTGTATFLHHAGQDLGAAPFVYGAQYEGADALATLPLDALAPLADKLPAPPPLGFLFSTGRCGSTLASRMLAAVPGVVSLSEPDALTNLAFARHHLDPPRADRLLTAATRLIAHAAGPAEALVLKPRSEAVLQMPAYARAFPEAKSVFLYRDAPGYVASMYRFIDRVQGLKDGDFDPAGAHIAWHMGSAGMDFSHAADFFPGLDGMPGIADILAMSWRIRIDACRDAIAAGATAATIHYADLTADRRSQTARLLEGCGIDPAHVDRAMTAFDRDAHAGTSSANAKGSAAVPPRVTERVRAHLDRWGLDDLTEARL